jgi:hypothetical protein
MRILVVGFGPLARKITDQIKRFPEYGLNNKVFIYHIFTRRNSLSYGKNLVVEIPDPHGDGYRTYNDGLQSLDEYATTISNYKPWLLSEAEAGSFQLVIDCTNRTRESYSLLAELLNSAGGSLKILPASVVGAEATISKIRMMLDGGEPWELVDFNSEMLKRASQLNAEAEVKMARYHQINRQNQIIHRGNPSGATAVDHYSIFAAIPDFDRDLVNRFVINGEDGEAYSRVEIYDAEHDCLVITHGLLEYFFGWHHTEQLAAKEFLDPELEIDSARYYKYLSNESTPMPELDSDYVIEYIHAGTLAVTTNDGLSSIDLVGGTEYSSFAYRPNTNPPAKKEIHAGLETIVFTYRKMKNAN